MLSNWWLSSSVAVPQASNKPFYVVPVAYDLVIGRDSGSVQRGFGQSGKENQSEWSYASPLREPRPFFQWHIH